MSRALPFGGVTQNVLPRLEQGASPVRASARVTFTILVIMCPQSRTLSEEPATVEQGSSQVL